MEMSDRSNHIADLYHAALERPAEQRAAFLLEATGGDDTLRQEVESLLAQESQSANSMPDQGGDPLVGTTISHYRVIQRLGAGGMGVVYRAHDERLRRDVALKILPAHRIASDMARDRFRNEAMALAKLNHPFIGTIYDFDSQNGVDFLVMECVSGTTLGSQLVSGPLPESEVLRLAIQIVSALEEAHEQGIVHRDLKPNNIMVTPKGQVKVLDFGLAKLLRPVTEGSTADELSVTVVAVGTLPYMAPEQIRCEPADTRTDVYAAGTVLYEMATGQRPFRTKFAPALAADIQNQSPPPPRQLNPKISVGLEDLILKCLRKKPDDRYRSARELAVPLEQLKAASQALQLPHSRFFTRRRVILLSVIALVLLFFSMRRWIQPPRILADRGWILIADPENLSQQQFFDKTLREGLTIALQQSRHLNVFPRTRMLETLARMKKTDLSRIDEALGREICQRENVHILLASTIRQSGDRFQITVRALQAETSELLFVESEQFAREEELFDSVDDLAKRVRKDLGESTSSAKDGTLPLAKVTTRSLEALQLYSRGLDALFYGHTEDAQVLFQNALELDPDFAMAHRHLANVYLTAGNRAKEYEHLARAYRLRESVTDRERRLIEARYFQVQGRYEQAVTSLLALVNLYPEDPDAHYSLAQAYVASSDAANGEKHLRDVLRLNPFSAPASSALVRVLARRNENMQAEQVYREAVGRGLQSPSLHWGLGLTWFGEGKLAEAREEFSRLLESGKTFQNIGRIFLARTSIYEGKFASAAEQLKSDLRSNETLASKSAELLERYLLARILVEQGKTDLARRELEPILTSGEPEALQAEDLRRTGTLYVAMKDLASAKNVLHRLDLLRTSTPAAFNESCFHSLAGELALAQGQIDSAIESFSAANAENQRFPSYQGLAHAFEARGDFDRATAAWRQVLQGRGEILQDYFPADWVLAHVQLARAYRSAGDLSTARSHYEEFFRIWETADELPVRQQALREWQKLNHENAPSVH
jgi:serine/threonine protein kinase/tetratricopeptide (TPR) repeat protein